MRLWLDAQLSPRLAPWLAAELKVETVHVRDLGLLNVDDREIFFAARKAEAVVVTKDSDFVLLVEDLGPPPQVIWVTVGNTSNEALRQVFRRALPQALAILGRSEPLVEIAAAQR